MSTLAPSPVRCHTSPEGNITVNTSPGDPARLLLTVEEAADRLGIGRTLMYALVKDGDVESVQIGRLRRIPAEALPAYLEKLRSSLPTTGDSAA